jgi:hypothetical protein
MYAPITMMITSAQIHQRLLRAGGWFEEERKSREPKLDSFDADRGSSGAERESFSGLPGFGKYSGKVRPLSHAFVRSSYCLET